MSKQSNKTVSLRRDQFIASWREYAPEATFAGVTLAQFEVDSKKPLELRQRMQVARTQLAGMLLERDKADTVLVELLVNIANSIRGNPDHGLNSPLYRSLGFVPKSERKRPKVRTAATGVEVPPDANAA